MLEVDDARAAENLPEIHLHSGSQLNRRPPNANPQDSEPKTKTVMPSSTALKHFFENRACQIILKRSPTPFPKTFFRHRITSEHIVDDSVSGALLLCAAAQARSGKKLLTQSLIKSALQFLEFSKTHLRFSPENLRKKSPAIIQTSCSTTPKCFSQCLVKPKLPRNISESSETHQIQGLQLKNIFYHTHLFKARN